MRLRPYAAPPASAALSWNKREASFAPIEGRLRNADRDEVEVRARDADAAFARARDALLAYDVYPEDVLRHRVVSPDGRVARGALIVQRIPLGPLAVEAGVRVVDAWDEPGRVGYRYVTLRGHPERGTAAFTVERREDRVAFRIESESQLADPYARLFAGYGRRRQRAAVAAAMARMRRRLEATPVPG